MKIEMSSIQIMMNYTCETNDVDFETEFVIVTDEFATINQINCLIESFIRLKEIHSGGEMFEKKRRIIHTKFQYYFACHFGMSISKFIVRISLKNEINFDKFICETDDFKTFKWFINTEKKLVPIKKQYQ